jgi:O-antigen ligase
MQTEPPSPTSRSHRGDRTTHAVALALPLVVIFASFLSGATTRWSEGIVLVVFALLLFVRPPRVSLGWPLNALAILFLALAATAFLPARWFFLPDWRTALTNDLGVQLASTLSAQPWLSLDSCVTLVAGLAWIYYVTALDVELRDVRLAARVFAGGMIAFAALCILLYLEKRALPFWHNVRNFGSYPNRNQTGDLFGISTLVVLACMQDSFRRGHKRWLLWLAGAPILVAALILDYSRAGILILVVGAVAWLARLAFRKWSGASVAVAVSLLLVLLTGLLLFGGETIARFHLRGGSDEGVTSDFRWLIFRDAWTMIKASPWCGVGLGNFEGVFALFREASHGVTRSLHPESDWLWLWSEMGWPSVAIVLVALALFVRRAFPLKEGTNQRLRYAALIGGLLFSLHGLVDVSGHRFGTFLCGTFLFGLAQLRPIARPPSRWPPILFRLTSLLLLAAGLTWFVAWRDQLLLPGYVGVENAKNAAAFANRGDRFAEALVLDNRALDWAPLDWQLYFSRGIARIGARQPAASALADFRRARFLEPSAWELPFDEGKVWLGLQPGLALSAWREALRRSSNPSAIYSQMFALAAQLDHRALPGLGNFATGDPRLTITYLENIPADKFAPALQQLLARDPDLKEFDTVEKKRLFALWSRHEPLDGLVRATTAHPDWLEFAWPGVARWQAGRGEYREAWRLVRQYSAPPPMPVSSGAGSLPELERKFIADPRDYANGYALYRAQLATGKSDDALSTIRHFTAQPDAPAYFSYLEAEGWAMQQNWQRAWQSWDDFRERASH